MKKLILALFFLSIFYACKKFQKVEIKTLISAHDEDESHRNGQNCMDCHYTEGGGAEGIFTAAGTIYGNTKNSNIELYNSETGALVRSIEVDKKGNGYTTEDINFGKGLKVGVRDGNGAIEFMDDKIYTGQCNSCHGTGIEEDINLD